MFYIIILMFLILVLLVLFILDKTNTIKKESKLRKRLEYLLLLPPILIVLAVEYYGNTANLKDFIIVFLCFLVMAAEIGLYIYFMKKVSWVKFLLPVALLILYELIKLQNHYLLTGMDSVLFPSFCTVLIVSWYRAIEKSSGLKIIMAVLAIAICFAVNWNMGMRLKPDSRIGQAITDFVSTTELARPGDFDFLIFDTEDKGIYSLTLLYGKTNDSSYESIVNLTYDHGDITYNP